MISGELDNEVGAAAELLHSSGGGSEATLRRVIESVRSVTGSAHAYVLSRHTTGSDAVVVAVSGGGRPQPGELVPGPPLVTPRRLTIPLFVDTKTTGWLVADDVGAPLRREAELELALLAGMAARSLQSHVVMQEAERRLSGELERQFGLMSGIALQLKTTLGSIDDALMLLESAPLAAEHEEQVIRGRRNLGTALRLLVELHDLGRAEAGQLAPDAQPMNLELLLREVVHEYEPAARAAGVSFDLDIAHIPLTRTDATCVRQVLDNLLWNAVRYSPTGAPITIRALIRSGRRQGDPTTWVRIDVVDRGPGVAEAEAVFDEAKAVARAGAPGFRLALSRRIARLLGGNLTLQTSPQSGSTFTLWLPLNTNQ